MSHYLVCFKKYGDLKIEPLKNSIKAIHKKMTIDQISSVIKLDIEKTSSEHIHDLKSVSGFSGYSLVILLDFDRGPVDLLKELQKIVTPYANNQPIEVKILCAERLTLIQPSLSLPDPDFHERADEISLAAEVWPDYIHPILNTSLLHLARRYKRRYKLGHRGEFYVQGKSLLDL